MPSGLPLHGRPHWDLLTGIFCAAWEIQQECMEMVVDACVVGDALNPPASSL